MTKTKLIKELVDTARELRALMNEINESLDINDVLDLDEEEFNFLRDFFKDYKSSYSLSLAYPESLWKVTAENIGLATAGKSRLDLAKEIFTISDEMETRQKEKPEEESGEIKSE